jgi:hypothetical protein
MTLILIYNNQTKVIEFMSAFDEYCCLFDEICKTIMETFNLSNLLIDYRMVYFDASYGSWINFNIHVTKRITEIIRHSTLQKLKIRIEQYQRNNTRAFIQKTFVDKADSTTTEDNSKLFSFLINIL